LESGSPPKREVPNGWRRRSRTSRLRFPEKWVFGSITAQDVASALATKGFEIDKRKIELDHPIKTLGDHTVTIKLHPDVPADVRVTVVPE
jgi:ribosomal protein L9